MKPYTIILLQLLLLITSSLTYAQNFAPAVKEFIVVADSVVAITNVKLIDGTGNAIKTKQTVIWTKNRIIAVGESRKVNIPAGARVIDGTNKTLIPGLVMLHEHLFHTKPVLGNFKATHMTNTFPQLYLAGGLTTMRTAGSIEAHTDLNIKNLIQAGKLLGPEIDVSTPHIERESFAPQLQTLYGNESPERMVDFWVDKGITSVKVYNNITEDDLQRIIKAAHARGIKVTGHLCGITYKRAAELGIDNLEHGFMASADFIPDKKAGQCDNGAIDRSLLALDKDSPAMKVLMTTLIQKNITITATPTVFEPFAGRDTVPGGAMEALAPFLQQQMREIYTAYARTSWDTAGMRLFEKDLYWNKQYHDMGGKLVVGTDPTGSGRVIAGYSNQRMIELLIEGGFTLPVAIKIASLNGARYLEIDKRTGSVEAGKEADLVLINGDLEKDKSAIRQMEIVFKDGIGYDSKKIFDSVKGKIGLD